MRAHTVTRLTTLSDKKARQVPVACPERSLEKRLCWLLEVSRSMSMFDVDVRCWMFDVGCSMLDVRCWMFDVGCWMFDVGCWMFDVGRWMLDVGCWMLVAGRWLLKVGVSHRCCRFQVTVSSVCILTSHSALRTPHSEFRRPRQYSALRAPHSAFRIQMSNGLLTPIPGFCMTWV